MINCKLDSTFTGSLIKSENVGPRFIIFFVRQMTLCSRWLSLISTCIHACMYIYTHYKRYMLNAYIDLHIYILIHLTYIYIYTYISALYIYIPPLNPGIFWGGKARNFWEIFHLTTWNIPPPHVFGASKRCGGGSSGCNILAQRWYGTPFHFEHTYIHSYFHTFIYI